MKLSALRFLLMVTFMLVLNGCGKPHPAVTAALHDFAELNPGIEIVSSRIGESTTNRVDVCIRFIHTPATAFPRQAEIREMEMYYQKETNGEWKLIQEKGSKFIRRAF